MLYFKYHNHFEIYLINMSVIIKLISANLTRDSEKFGRMDPYVKVFFGGQQFRSAVCRDGSRNPFWNDSFTFNSSTDTTIRFQVWDQDMLIDDNIGCGTYNIAQVYNLPGQRSDSQYVDLYYKGNRSGRLLIGVQVAGMGMGGFGQQNMMGQQQNMMGGQFGGNFQDPMGYGGQNNMNNGWGVQPPMNNNGWGVQPPMNNFGGMNNNPFNSNNGFNGNNNGWGY